MPTTDKDREVVAYLNALTTGAALSFDFTRQLAVAKVPITDELCRRVHRACVKALLTALEDDGNVVSVTCPTVTEAMCASYFLAENIPAIEKVKAIKLRHELSTTTRFELSNNSCVLVILGGGKIAE